MAATFESEHLQIKPFPNPAHADLTIQLPDDMSRGAELRIYDTNGKAILTSSVRGESHTIDVRAMHNGPYVLRVNNGKRTAIAKFLKE